MEGFQKVKFEDMKNALAASQTPLPISVRVYGRVKYSHIRTKIDKEELQKQNERDKSNGIKPEYNPHYLITVDSNVQIQADPETPEIVTSYLMSKISKSGTFSIKSKSPFPPAFAVSQGVEPVMVTDDEGRQIPITNTEQLPSELKKGLLVCLGVSIYGSANGMGVGLDYVVACEAVKYMQSSSVDMGAALSKIGVVNPSMFPQQAPETPVGTPNTAPMPTSPMAGAQAPAPMAPAPGQMAAAPQQAAATAAPAQAAPAQTPYYGQPAPRFMQPPVGDPLYGTPIGAPNNAGGITYSPS